MRILAQYNSYTHKSLMSNDVSMVQSKMTRAIATAVNPSNVRLRTKITGELLSVANRYYTEQHQSIAGLKIETVEKFASRGTQ
jgi:hypothetical protein